MKLDEYREEPSRRDEGVYPRALGTYHMIHRIDGEVAIVCVFDITNESFSSQYLFYDPKWLFLSPGTLSAIRELEYMNRMRRLGLAATSFRWYTQSRYFYDCQKSAYKASFRPS